MDQSYLNGNVDTLFKSLENFTQTEGIIGKPVTQGDKTFLPVVSITVGYGSGNASMKGQSSGTSTTAGSGNSGTGALGLGAKLSTDAVIVIDSQNVFMLPVNSSASSGNLVDKIPQIISGMKTSGTSGSGASNQTNSTNASSQTQNTQYGNTKSVQNTTKY
jgi:uncharacterized spore protein YtfJ